MAGRQITRGPLFFVRVAPRRRSTRALYCRHINERDESLEPRGKGEDGVVEVRGETRRRLPSRRVVAWTLEPKIPASNFKVRLRFLHTTSTTAEILQHVPQQLLKILVLGSMAGVRRLDVSVLFSDSCRVVVVNIAARRTNCYALAH